VAKKLDSLHLASLDFCPKKGDYHKNKTALVGKEAFGHRRKNCLKYNKYLLNIFLSDSVVTWFYHPNCNCIFHQGFLSVGIPSIGRKTKSYLIQTLTSVLGAIREEERENITVVTFLADFDTLVKEKQLGEITRKFKKYITSGVLQVIQAPSGYYAPLRDLHRSLGEGNSK
jgi:hypothetical protein